MPQDELAQELLNRALNQHLTEGAPKLGLQQPPSVVGLPQPKHVPFPQQSAMDRFLSGAITGAGGPQEDEPGGGLAALAGYLSGTAATGGLGMFREAAPAVTLLPPKIAKMLATKLVDNISVPEVKSAYEAMLTKAPRLLGHTTQIIVDHSLPAYGFTASELEHRAQDLAREYIKGRPNITLDQAHEMIREQLMKNLPPERIDSLSRLNRQTINPIHHDSIADAVNTAGHESLHGADILRMGPQFSDNIRTELPQMEQRADSAGQALEAQYQTPEFRAKRQAMLTQLLNELRKK